MTFYDDGTAIGTGTLAVSSGVDQASYTTSALATGSNTITADYTSGDGNFFASPASSPITQVVGMANTATSVATSGTPSVSGQSVTFTATVTVVGPGSTAVAYPTGTVMFMDGSTQIGTGTLAVSPLGNDEASYTTFTLSTGSHTITAVYNGDENFNGTLYATTVTQVVGMANTATSVATSGSPTVPGQSVTFTATVTVADPGSTAVASPTGTVTFYDDGTSIGTGTLAVVNGLDQASYTTSALGTGSNTITAAYTSGDVNFNTSGASAGINQAVTEVPSLVVTTLADDSDPYDGQTSLPEALAYNASLGGGNTVTFAAGLHGAIDLSTSKGGLGTLTLASNVTIQGPSDNSITIEGGASPNVSTNAEVLPWTPASRPS